METTAPLSIPKPWLTIWLSPRKTIRRIVDTNPEYMVIPLAVFSGVYRVLDRASKQGLGDSFPLTWILVLALLGGLVGGVISLYLTAALFRWTGSWLGGQATSKEVRCAVAWSSIPDVLLLVAFIPAILVFGQNWFTSSAEWLSPQGALAILTCSASIGIPVTIWRIIMLVKCLAEVHRFSAWRALAALVLGVVIVVGPYAVLLYIQRITTG